MRILSFLLVFLFSPIKVNSFLNPSTSLNPSIYSSRYSSRCQIYASDGEGDHNVEGDSFFGKLGRFYNELVPWGDPTKGFSAQPGKREAMIIKYVERTGCSKEVAEKEVDEYLADKEGYVIRKRAEEAKAAAAAKEKQN